MLQSVATRAKFIQISGDNPRVPNILFRDVKLFQEEGQDGLVITTSVTIAQKTDFDKTKSGPGGIRVRPNQVRRAVEVLMMSDSYGVSYAFWPRLQEALEGWEALPWQEISEEDLNRRFYQRIGVGRRGWWIDPADFIAAAPETVKGRWVEAPYPTIAVQGLKDGKVCGLGIDSIYWNLNFRMPKKFARINRDKTIYIVADEGQPDTGLPLIQFTRVTDPSSHNCAASYQTDNFQIPQVFIDRAIVTQKVELGYNENEEVSI